MLIILASRYGPNRKASLRVFLSCHQTWTIPPSWMRSHMSHRGHVCVVADTQDRILSLNSRGFLDSLKSPLKLVEHRVSFYQFTISAILESIGVPTEKLQFVLGSSFQKSPEYIMDVYKLSVLVSEHDAKRAGAEIVKQSDNNSPLSGLLYPILRLR